MSRQSKLASWQQLLADANVPEVKPFVSESNDLPVVEEVTTDEVEVEPVVEATTTEVTPLEELVSKKVNKKK